MTRRAIFGAVSSTCAMCAAGKFGRLARRRPRGAQEHPPWLMHVAAVEGDARGAVEYETDRARFLGRGHTTADPVAVPAGDPGERGDGGVLSGSAGAVLDPIVSLRYR